MRRFIAPFLVALIAFAGCSRRDPLDDSSIERDLDKRGAQELYDESANMTFTPPADGRLTEAQITNFQKMASLAERIRKIAERRFGTQVDRAGSDRGSLSRMGDSFAAFGSARTYATADLRACLDLGLNPKEEEWVDIRIDETVQLINQLAPLERETEKLRLAADNESNFDVMLRKRALFHRAQESERTVLQRYEPSVIDNAKLVRAHADDLRPFFSELARNGS